MEKAASIGVGAGISPAALSNDPDFSSYSQFISAAPALHRRIIIIDDSPTHLYELSHILSAIDNVEVETYAAADAELLQHIAMEADIVILDNLMPHKSGLEFIRDMRNADLKRIPIVMLTSSHELNVRCQAHELGVADFVTKPVNPIGLRLKIERLLLDRCN